jgi:hypothetical protein
MQQPIENLMGFAHISAFDQSGNEMVPKLAIGFEAIAAYMQVKHARVIEALPLPAFSEQVDIVVDGKYGGGIIGEDLYGKLEARRWVEGIHLDEEAGFTS